MSGDIRRALRLLVLPTIVLLAVAAFVPGRLEPGVRLYALLACAVALGVAVAALRRAYPPAGRLRGATRDGERRPWRPRSLVELENVTALGVADAGDLHSRLRPRVRDLAAGLLESRYGVSLDRQPEASRAILGDETWQLVRAERPVPAEERAPGLSQAALERVVASLERL